MTIRSIQGLRAIAALMVVCVHTGNPQGFEARYLSSPHPITEPLSRIGYLGVDLFFVISGFIMIITTFRKDGTRLSAGRFFENRVIRIYPPLWVINTLVLIVFVLKPSLVNSHNGPPDILASYLLLPQAGSPLILVAWTLVYEMYFYLVFSFALLFPRRGFAMVIASWAAALVLLQFASRGTNNIYLAFLGDTLSFEFLIGIIAGVLYQRAVSRTVAIASTAIGTSIFAVIAGFVAAGVLPSPAGYSRVALALTLGAVVLGVASLEKHFGSFTPNILVRIGDGSYAMYLWHIPVLTVVGLAMAATHPHSSWLRSVYTLLVFVLIIVVGLAVFRYVEKPITTALRTLTRRNRATDR